MTPGRYVRVLILAALVGVPAAALRAPFFGALLSTLLAGPAS